MKKSQETIYYYNDLQNDDFGLSPQTLKQIKGDYNYSRRNLGLKIFDFITYRFILTPIAWIYTRVFLRTKIVNRKLLKKAKKEGAFIYANHTHGQLDAFAPSIYSFPKKVSVVVNSTNVSLPVLGNLTKAWGALPLPEDYTSSKNFIKEIEYRVMKKQFIVIYPEARLWPYYTKIRPFSSRAFHYPIKTNVKTFAATTTYQTKQNGKLKRVIYIDGPFITSPNLTVNEASIELHHQVSDIMKKRSALSNYEKIKYIYQEKK